MELQQFENSVNALSQAANQTNKSEMLIQLHKIAEKITNSNHKIVKIDLNKSEPGRPLRILSLNHGIIATRTDDVDTIGYLNQVNHVMETFYNLTYKPTLH